MRLTLIAVPVVLLGAGGYYLFHSSASPAEIRTAPAAVVTDHRGEPVTLGGHVVVMPGAHQAQPSPPNEDSAPTPRPGLEPTPSAVSVGTAVGPRANLGSDAPESVAARAPNVKPSPGKGLAGTPGTKAAAPKEAMPGTAKMRQKVKTLASCQGVDAQQKYAALIGEERAALRASCAQVGVTLPP